MAIAGSGAVVAMGAGEEPAPAAQSLLAVLREPASETESLPDNLASGSLSGEISGRSDARLLGAFDGSDWYVAPGREKGSICLLQDDKANKASGGVCTSTKSVKTGLALSGTSPAGGESVAILAPDGYSTDGDAPKADKKARGRNAVFLTVSEPTTVKITGTNKAPISLSLAK